MKHAALRFWKSEWKRALTAFPRLFCGALLFLALLLSLIWLIARSLYAAGSLPITRIAVVNQDTDVDTSLALSYIESFRSTSSLFTFEEMTAEQAETLLSRHQIIAAITLPSGTLDGIMHGENMPITVTFAGTGGLSGLLLSELTRSGASLLGSAQAAIYASIDLYDAHALSIDLQAFFDTVNRKNLQAAMRRETLFTMEVSSVTGNASVPVFYGATLLLLFFICCGTLYHVQFSENRALQAVLVHMGLSSVSEAFIRLVILFIENLVFALFLLLLLRLELLRELFPHALPLIPALGVLAAPLLLLSAFELLCYRLVKEPPHGILWLFFTGILLLFVSGTLLPAAFLPKIFGKAAPFLPVFWCHRLLMHVLDGSHKSEPVYLASAFLSALLLFLLAVLHDRYRRRTAL